MVLSNSRNKYGYWQTRPFNTADFVIAHIKAFKFFGGRPKQIVYDQDKVLSVSENHGDIILTEGFQNFVNAMGFEVVLCHGADPESKGRIESVVKYFKRGFAAHRVLGDIDVFNADFIAWLDRTGNAKVHGTTKKIPAEQFKLEKEYLIPVPEYSFAQPTDKRKPYIVRKDNIVLYKGNRYRVPKGTYKEGKRVQAYVICTEGIVTIIDTETGVLFAKHRLCEGKGELIGERTRNFRDKSKTILELEESVKKLFGGTQEICDYLEVVHTQKIRYYRDQLGQIKGLFSEWDSALITEALNYCINNNLYSAGELASATFYIATMKAEKKANEAPRVQLPEKYRGPGPQMRDLSEYGTAMRRTNTNG
ncbi:MAG: DDE-type integrase/transposase/recombinase [Clostridia bacterium]|nr:DDE-type integrase/transposase/recombinase [Clostridia bacterium]